MKRLILAAMICLLAGAARAAVTEPEMRGFAKNTSTYDQVVAKLGQPDKVETTDEGLRAIGYLPAGTNPATFSPTALFGGVNGVTPTTAASAAGTAALEFDRSGRLINYIAFVGAGASPKRISSEDGAAPMPQVTLTVSEKDRAALKFENDGKPHLGIQISPSDGQPAEKAAFAAAKFAGMIVGSVLPGAPADRSGIKTGDYLYMLNGYIVTSEADVTRAMASVKLGDQIRVRARRIDRATRTVSEQAFTLRF